LCYKKIVIRVPNDAVANRIFQKLAFESDEWRRFTKLAYGASRLIDVGASGGFYSLIFAKTRTEASKAAVLSIECDPGSLDILQFVKDRNSDGSPWEVVPEAVCGKKGQVQLVSSGYGAIKANTDEVGSTTKFDSEMNRKPYTEFAVEGDTLESIAAKRSFIPDIIKMDIDGMEAEVIEESTEWLSRHNLVYILRCIRSIFVSLASHPKNFTQICGVVVLKLQMAVAGIVSSVKPLARTFSPCSLSKPPSTV
jgi:FkbM family methyltransferase